MIPVSEMGYALSGLTMLSYGMGWFIRPYPFAAGTLVFHDGNVEGHSAHVCFVPEARAGVVALANAAMSSVPTIVAREALDRVLGLPRRDWNRRFHATHDPLLAAISKGEADAAGDRAPDAPPTRPLADYTGSYAADGYPDFAVRQQGDALQACTVGSIDWSQLRHRRHDIFDWHIPLWDNSWFRASFSVDGDGTIGAVSLPLAAGVPDIVFRRKPLVVDAATLDALAGDYDPGIAGLVFHISHRNGKLFWTETGQPAMECLPRALGGNEAVFGIEDTRVVFTRVDGQWARVAARTRSATYEARRRP